MTDGIRKAPPSPPVPTTSNDANRAADAAHGKVPAPRSEPGAESAPPQAVDSFTLRDDKKMAQLETKLQHVAQKTSQKLHFSNDDLRLLAQTFAATMRLHPDAERQVRARLFAEAVLKQKRLRRLLEKTSNKELEAMCDSIGDVLENSPVFAKLVDDVSDGASKLIP